MGKRGRKPIPMAERGTCCRFCGVLLTESNGRSYAGRWAGACRPCESKDAGRRKKARPSPRK